MSVGLYSGTSGLALGVGLYSGVPGFWSGATGLIDGLSPALDLNFLSSTSLDSRVTFSRGSAATLTDSTGKLTYAPNNLFTFSEQFDNAAWTKGAAVTIGANAATAPDGTTTADQITITGVDNGVYQSVTVVPGVAYVQSWYVRLGTLSASDYKFALYNNTAGSFIAADIAPSPTPNSTGWTRITYTFTAPAGCTSVRVYVNRSPSVSAGTLFVWGAQLEQVTYQTTPGTYVATTSSAYQGPRFDYDPVTLAPRGLLIEEQRTNLLVRSEEFDNASWNKTGATVTANATISPDGTVNADKIVETATTAPHAVYQVFTYGAGLVYAATVYAKKAERNWIYLGADTAAAEAVFFDLDTGTVGSQGTGYVGSITNAGNGWYRCTVIITQSTALPPNFLVVGLASANGTPSYAGNGTSGLYIWGAQLEARAFATSYIPTVASQVTRSADVATITGANFSQWYNQSEGTFVVEFDDTSVGASYFTNIYRVDDGTANNRMALYRNASPTSVGFDVTTGGVSQVNAVTATASIANPTKHAVTYKANDFAASVNGGTVATDTSGTVPSGISALRLGRDTIGSTTTILNGHIRSIRYYPQRLTNAQLQALTA